ncbi:glyoxalase superfamily protein [Alcanivorax sp. 24]|nr:glyoxalase superfamily protein [Alcanivorax sp. 24]
MPRIFEETKARELYNDPLGFLLHWFHRF